MKRFLVAFAAFATFAFLSLTIGVAVATADDPKPADQAPQAGQPKGLLPVQPGGLPNAAQPAQGVRIAPVTAARLAALEEELETLEAHRDVRKAHVKAAEVAVKAAALGVERVRGLATKGIVSKEEIDKAELEVEAARAQLDIRVAETKEVEVKIKYAKKRLDEAKAAGVRPAPGAAGANPFRNQPVKPIDPPPQQQ